jgi:hypothetical protein
MSQYFVTIEEDSDDISVFAVDADSAVAAARKVSRQAERDLGADYHVEPGISPGSALARGGTRAGAGPRSRSH